MQLQNLDGYGFTGRGVRCKGRGIAQAGLTMVELMVVISIAAILMAMAAPSFTALANKTRLSSAVSQLSSDLNLARSEAVKRNARMLVCPPNAAGTGCQTVSPNWAAGWIVCVDADSDGACDASTAANPNPLVTRPALEAGLTLVATDTASTPATVTFVRFSANGRQGAGALSVNMMMGGTWTGAVSKTLAISNTGNISIY